MLNIQLQSFIFASDYREILKEFLKDYSNILDGLNDIKKHIDSDFNSGGLLWNDDFELVQMFNKYFPNTEINDYSKLYSIKQKMKTIAKNFIKGV